MWQKFIKQLEKIQNSDEATKKKWLVATTVVVMILVIGLWLIYINSTIMPASDLKNQEPPIGFWQVFKTGLKVAINSLKESFNDFISEISTEHTITIEK